MSGTLRVIMSELLFAGSQVPQKKEELVHGKGQFKSFNSIK